MITISCSRSVEFPVNKTVVCDAEHLNKKGDKFVAENDSGFYFDGGRQRTSLQALSGKYSVITFPKKKSFAFAHTIKHAGPDWYFKVSVWRKSKDGKGILVVSGKDSRKFYQTASEPAERRDDGWEKLELETYTPPYFRNNQIAFYVWNNGSDTVFFDDLIIERKTRKKYPEYKEPPLAIVLDSSDYLKILDKRRRAFEYGVLQSGDNDWVKGIVFSGDKMMKAKLRLKGDWLDHLRGTKWSWRIKLKKGYAWNHLRTFSVQTPKARDFLKEYEAHKFFISKDLLTTRYGFVPLIFNNQSRGLYAWEEHFVKQLLESRDRREGPILKFSEDAFWQMQRNALITNGNWPSLPYYEASVIKPFKESKTIENPKLHQDFLNGQKLMYQYKHQLATPAEIFDIKKMAGYFAMMDLMKITHGKAWHNQRFYYNPVICKLEPIAFDGYSEHLTNLTGIQSNTAYQALQTDVEITPEQLLFYNLFTDSVFIRYYLQSLYEISDPAFVLKVKNEIGPDLHKYDSLIRMEFPYYRYDNDFIIKNAEAIREYLPGLKSFIEEKLESGRFNFKVRNNRYTDTLIIDNTPEFLVTAYLQKQKNDTVVLKVFNYNPKKITLLGTGPKRKYVVDYLLPAPEIEAYTDENERSVVIKSDTNARFLFFLVDGHFKTFSVPVNRWPYPEGKTAQQELIELVNLTGNPAIKKIEGKEIYIKKGRLKTGRPLIIPAGYTVHFLPGTTLDLVNKAMFITYSPVIMQGTKENPVVITSSDFSGNGFTVLQADKKSTLDHVVFENLNTLDYKGWTLTGAVTFYESDVDISNTRFYRNQCEDALNTIRSGFRVNNCSFEYIFSDAFDSDFCTGKLTDSRFTNIGNDAIDFSGSRINISYCKMEDVSDKGVSGGENSHLTVSHVEIVRANIGVASKDLSAVELDNSQLKDCNYGLVLLQKKPEYGPATMTLNKTEIINAKTPMLIEKGSSVTADGKVIKGKKEKLADIFYK